MSQWITSNRHFHVHKFSAVSDSQYIMCMIWVKLKVHLLLVVYMERFFITVKKQRMESCPQNNGRTKAIIFQREGSHCIKCLCIEHKFKEAMDALWEQQRLGEAVQLLHPVKRPSAPWYSRQNRTGNAHLHPGQMSSALCCHNIWFQALQGVVEIGRCVPHDCMTTPSYVKHEYPAGWKGEKEQFGND